MARLRRGGARTAIERFYPHAPHQRSYMPTTDLAPLGSQQASQHARTAEWVLVEFFLCKSVGECVDIFKPGKDGAEIGKLDGVAGVEFLAEQDGVFEDFLGRGPDRYAHGPS